MLINHRTLEKKLVIEVFTQELLNDPGNHSFVWQIKRRGVWV